MNLPKGRSISDTQIPWPLGLLAKCLVLTVIFCDNRFPNYGEVYTSLIPGLEAWVNTLANGLVGPSIFTVIEISWKVLYCSLAAALLFNFRLRESLFVIGLLILFGISANQVLFNNNTFFLSLLLLIIASAPSKWIWGFISIEVAILYLMTVASKGEGWYTGDFLATLLQERPFFHKLIPSNFIARNVPVAVLIGCSIFALIVESTIGILFLFGKTRQYGALVGLLFHSFLCFFLANLFNIFYPTLVLLFWVVLLGKSKLVISIPKTGIAHKMIDFLYWVASPLVQLETQKDISGGGVEVSIDGKSYGSWRANLLFLKHSPIFMLLTPLIFFLFRIVPGMNHIAPFVLSTTYTAIILADWLPEFKTQKRSLT